MTEARANNSLHIMTDSPATRPLLRCTVRVALLGLLGCVLAGMLLAGAPARAQSGTMPTVNNPLASNAAAGTSAIPPSVRRDHSSDLSTLVSLRLEDVTLEQALRRIAEESDLNLVYGSYAVLSEKSVALRLEQVPARAALEEALRGTDLRPVLSSNGQVVLVNEPGPKAATTMKMRGLDLEVSSIAAAPAAEAVPRRLQQVQEGTIEGTVTEAETGKTIPGVNVIVVDLPEQNLGAATDAEGQYEIEGVPAGEHTIRAQFVGYQSQTQSVEVVAGETVTVDFELGKSTMDLGEVVVTGVAGEARKRSLGNSITQVDAMEAVEIEGVNNVEDLLTGRTPGVSITPGTGVVGSGPKIDARGRASFVLSEQPLIYIDGIRMDNATAVGPDIQGGAVTSRLNDIDPENIESVEILKGPSAATLYGTEASAGVIQMTTKEGFSGESEYRFTTSQGANWFRNAVGRIPINWGENPNTGEIMGLNILKRERNRGNKIFSTGHMQKYTFGARGGSDKVQYNAFTSYKNEEGIEPTNILSRFNSRLSLTLNPIESLTANLKLGLISGDTELAREYGISTMWAISRARPSLLNTPLRGFWTAPPEVVWDVYETKQEYSHYNWVVQLDYSPTTWLTQQLTVGEDIINEDNIALQNRANPYQAQFFSASGARGSKDVLQREVTNTTFEYNGTVNASLIGELTSNSSVGLQYYSTNTEFSTTTGAEFPVGGLSTVDATSRTSAGGNFIENTTIGAYFQQKFSWAERIYLTGAIRADDNSAFGRDYQAVIYPKVSASWVISEAPYWNIGVVDELRLRGAYGESGRQPDAFASLRVYSPVTGPGGQPAVTPLNIGNSNLGPERGKEIETGFNASLFDGRATLDFTYYDQTTTDAILTKQIAPSRGFSEARFVNAGTIKSQGFELGLYVEPIATDNVNLGLDFNIARRGSEVTGLDLESPGADLERLVGHSPSAIFQKIMVSADVNDEGKATNMMCRSGKGGNGPVPCQEAPLLHYGDQSTDYEGTLNTSLTLFDNLTLNARFDFQEGAKKQYWDGVARCSIYRICKASAYPQEADPVKLAEIQAGQSDLRTSWWQSTDFIKFRLLSLNYSVPKTWTEKLGGETASITLSARNLHTWSGYGGIDPESAVLSSGAESGFSQAVVPQLTTFTTVLSISF